MRTGRISLAVAAALVTATPAPAFDTHVLGYGSLFLTDFSTLIDKSPKLKAEINDALEKAGKKLDERVYVALCLQYRRQMAGDLRDREGHRAERQGVRDAKPRGDEAGQRYPGNAADLAMDAGRSAQAQIAGHRPRARPI